MQTKAFEAQPCLEWEFALGLMGVLIADRIKGARSEHRIKQGRNTVYVRRRAIAISEVAIEFTID